MKPANFLLVRGRLKLIDFGIASTVNADMTSVVKNTSLGTLNYISPEAIIDIGGNGDSSSDDNKYKVFYFTKIINPVMYHIIPTQLSPISHFNLRFLIPFFQPIELKKFRIRKEKRDTSMSSGKSLRTFHCPIKLLEKSGIF